MIFYVNLPLPGSNGPKKGINGLLTTSFRGLGHWWKKFSGAFSKN